MTKLTQQEIERERKRFEEFAQKNNISQERWTRLWETWLAGVLSARELFLSELEKGR